MGKTVTYFLCIQSSLFVYELIYIESSSSRKWHFSWLKMSPTNPFEPGRNHAFNDNWNILLVGHNEKQFK